MRNTVLATAAAISVMAATPVMAQTAQPAAPPPSDSQAVTGARPGNQIGTGNSLPKSDNASNINRGDTRADIAPRLPVPSLGDTATPRDFLAAAQQALQRNRTGEAQEALERAETRLLDRSTSPGDVDTPDQGPMIRRITDARMALSKGDRANALKVIQQAMAASGGTGPSGAGTGGAVGSAASATSK